MRTDALDRFGTRLEQRFSAREIKEMMTDADLEDIRFSDMAPFWCVVGRRRAEGAGTGERDAEPKQILSVDEAG